MEIHEALGEFYLGRICDPDSLEPTPQPLLYDSKDLTTHAVIVGMTGSGKTGLGITLLEEAALDSIPALIIDPKGDMGNLALTFPELRTEDFQPWISADEASRSGRSLDALAADKANLWNKGINQWSQSPARIERLKSAAEVTIYTPGSDAGVPLSVLDSFQAPPEEVRLSPDGLREAVGSAAAGLCSLLGLDPDPVRGREQVFFANILDHAWRSGRNLDLEQLIYEVQSPSLRKIGLMDLEQVYPASERMQLAMMLNNVIGAPGFAAWRTGEPLDIQRMLWSPEGRPRLAVVSIAHLSDRERMFFLTLLLNKFVSWVRSQPGTSSLRALLYMDEVFGYLPPTANPPSKTPLLTLLKQARAHGVGLVLATQNPVDLDYKALSNAGTWFLGRLQTERDKLRMLDGLQSAAAGGAFSRSDLDQLLSRVGSRVFVMNNVHEDHPVVMHSRWALSYLSGPMSREQIDGLMADRKSALASQTPPPAGHGTPTAAPLPVAEQPPPAASSTASARPPLLPARIEQLYEVSSPSGSDSLLIPHLLGRARVHFVDSKSSVDLWQDVERVVRLGEDIPADIWAEADTVPPGEIRTTSQAPASARWEPLPAAATDSTSYTSWKRDLKDDLYRNQRLTLFCCPSLKLYSTPDETRDLFTARVRLRERELRDEQKDKLREKFASKIRRQQERVRSAESRQSVEEEQASSATTSAWLSTVTSALGVLFGRKWTSVGNVSRAGTAARAHQRASKQRSDIERARQKVEQEREELEELERELETELKQLTEAPPTADIEEYLITPRKSDLDVQTVALLWRPAGR